MLHLQKIFSTKPLSIGNMENFIYKDYLGQQNATEDTEVVLRRLHREHPHSNVITALFLKMLQSEHPKEYDRVKGKLLLSIPHRKYFSEYKIAEECTTNNLQFTIDNENENKVPILSRRGAEGGVVDNENIVNDEDLVVEKEFEAPTIQIEADQTQVINSLIAKFSYDPPTIKKTPENHNPDANYSEGSLDEDSDIVSETLAIIYAKQGHPGKAIKMLQKLCLIFPEKSCYFAALIEGIKSERNNNQIN